MAKTNNKAEQKSELPWYISWFIREGSVVKTAPWLFAFSVVIAIVIIGTGIFFILQWHFAGTTSGLNATISAITAERDAAIRDNEKLKSENSEKTKSTNNSSTAPDTNTVKTLPAPMHLKIIAVEQNLNSGMVLPNWSAYRLVADIDGQKYSLPTTQPFLNNSLSESIAIPAKIGEFHVSFERQDFSQLRALHSNTNGFATQNGITDVVQLNHFTTNGLIIQKTTGEMVGTTKIIYEITD